MKYSLKRRHRSSFIHIVIYVLTQLILWKIIMKGCPGVMHLAVRKAEVRFRLPLATAAVSPVLRSH
jgi:hypothetical protein